MDFFEAQDQARRKTWKLVLLYLIAVVLIIVSVYLAVIIAFDFIGESGKGSIFWGEIWIPELMLTVSAIVLIIIISGTLYRVFQLRRGGEVVAEMLGGRKVEPSTKDLKERQLLNVVEEMSIASGLPVPEVYVLDNEENINAFAAGFGTNDAVIGVTRGTLEQLNRDELQGVIAHEFSHIFNGDMRLNIRLIGILNGILLLHIIGMIMFRGTFYGGTRIRSSKNSGKKGGAAAILILAISLIVIGYIGMLFGRMIQASISRQREYLADAAAVQYTRNPDGLAGALRKIGQLKKGGSIQDGHAMELSHLFFANSYHSAISSAFATHPPLEKRIQAINPAYDPKFDAKKKQIRKRFDTKHVSGTEAAQGATASHPVGDHPALQPELILAAIGSMGGGQTNKAERLLSKIPEKLQGAAHEPFGAEALIYALLLSGQKEVANDVPGWLQKNISTELSNHIMNLLSELEKGNREWYLPLAGLSLPALRKMSENQYEEFRTNVKRLSKEDDRISLFEFALEKMIIRQLDTYFSEESEAPVKHHHFKTLKDELNILLSAVAHASESDTESAWKAGLKPIEKLAPEGMKLLSADECGVNELDKVLDEFAASAFPVKKYTLSAIIHSITSDQKISIEETELLRAVSETMDCPIPLGTLG